MFPSEPSDIPKTDYQFVETVEENEKLHSARDIQRARQGGVANIRLRMLDLTCGQSQVS